MEDIFDGAWRERFVARDPAVEAELARLIDIHGPALIEQSSQLRQALLRASPDGQRHVAVLLAALSAGVAERLRAAEDDPDVPGLLERCVTDLQAHGVVDGEWAWWAVRTWAHAFALPTGHSAPSPVAATPTFQVPLSPEADDPSETAPPPVRPASAPLSGNPATPSIRPRADPSVAPWIVGADATTDVAVAPERRPMRARMRTPVEPVLPPAVVEADPPAFLAPTADADRPMFAVPRPDLGPPVFVDPPPATGATEPTIGRLPEPILGEPVLQVEPLFTDRDLKRLSVDEPGFVAAPPLAAASITAAPEEPAGRGRRALLVALLVGLPLAALIGFFASRWIGGTPATDTTAAKTSDFNTTADNSTSPAAAPANTAPAAPAHDPASDALTRKALGLPPATSAAQTTERSAAATERSSTTTPAAEPPPAAARGESTPGTAQTAGPSSAAPAIAPAIDDARPVIAGIEAPRIAEGVPFVVVVEVAGDARNVAAIERHFVDRVGAWPRDGSVSGASLKRAGNALLVRFGAIRAPAMATVEFTVVLRDGTRSEPRSVTLAVAAPRGRETTATSAECSPSTCGSVVETREVAPDSRFQTPLYSVVVQLDDHERFSYTAPYRPQLGTRMRRTGSTFVPAP